MARPKKPAEDKPKEGAGITIDVNDYVRTRDQVRHSFHFPPSSPCLSATTGSTAPHPSPSPSTFNLNIIATRHIVNFGTAVCDDGLSSRTIEPYHNNNKHHTRFSPSSPPSSVLAILAIATTRQTMFGAHS